MDNCLNTHSPINCCHPIVCLNSSFYSLYLRGFVIHLLCPDSDKVLREYTMRCSSSPLSENVLSNRLLWYKYHYVNVDNCYTNFYFEKGDERYPLFYLFACGKCELCRAKKSSEYVFRAACETCTYPVNPLFVTLTYRPETLPPEGLNLRHLQNFFKRLRWRLQLFGFDTSFRYLAVGEYGAKHGRPHFHIIFWNLPSDTERIQERMQSFIRYAWSEYALDSFGRKRQFTLPRSGKVVYARRSLGIVKILPVTNGCPAYICKYFRKEQHNKCGYLGKNFLVSSRKNGGIGSQYIDSFRSFYESSPALPSLQVVDNQTRKIFQYPLTGYVKSRLFPSLSGCFTKNIESGVSYYIYLSRMTNWIHEMCAIAHHITVCQIRHKLNPLTWSLISDFCKQTKYFFRSYSREYYLREYSYYSHSDLGFLMDKLYEYFARFSAFYREIDWNYVSSRLKYYKGFLYIKKLQNKNNRVFYYNIPDNLLTFGSQYERYLTKSVF